MSRQIKLFIDFISERPKILCADAISKFCSAAAPLIMVCPSFVNLCERVLALKQLRAYIHIMLSNVKYSTVLYLY